VLGARANRIPDLIDVCCAVIGKVPEYGLYITENRAGELLFRLEGFDDNWFSDAVDYAVLGYYAGEIAIQRNPVIEGLPKETTNDQLKALSAALASGGATALFHAVGLTPEARTLEEAFQGKTGYEIIIVTPENLMNTKNKLTTATKGKVDMVLLGCPHFSFDEIRQTRDMIKGRKVATQTRFWIMTSKVMYDLAVRAGVAQELEDAGVEFIRDTCLMVSDTDKNWGFETLVTNSGKAAQYVAGLFDMDVAIKSTLECVDIAISGDW
jgi:predicted aconitase